MSHNEGICSIRFLAIIFIIDVLQTTTLMANDLMLIPDGNSECFWRRTENQYELISSPDPPKSVLAKLSTSYSPAATVPMNRRFCISFVMENFDSGHELTLRLNSFVRNISGSQPVTECLPVATFSLEISIETSCEFISSPSPRLTNIRLGIDSASTTAPSNADLPTTDVGDIQYVGVVVGAICIALFTLFSCLTILSARRSNQRESRRRAVPSTSYQDEEDNGPDVVADNAPPSYDAVMASPERYPPTPQGTPHATPQGTPHGTPSLHRRVLLTQQAVSLPGSIAATPQLDRASFPSTPQLNRASFQSDDIDGESEEPPPPYPGLANTENPNSTREDATNVELQPTNVVQNQGVENAGVNVSPTVVTEDPWVLNSVEENVNKNRENNPTIDENNSARDGNEEYLSDSINSNENNRASTSSTNIQVTQKTEEEPSTKTLPETMNEEARIEVSVL
ncbi:uncharacterized protein LOC124450995 isoform X2 [Xenia sp. Carnegie-2017]|uniref:uncharacterized protein LOC124450995 isoform X2 n=1 Tax=Xenia sp. Carnegie-2017 TaxID=2897299 RepID=UPI001F046733|nr:uncharacterized protein LOC124450995 isoform X2 [Xenia sp. Carnegie-2017]